jgi:hypothetical protein
MITSNLNVKTVACQKLMSKWSKNRDNWFYEVGVKFIHDRIC